MQDDVKDIGACPVCDKAEHDVDCPMQRYG